jgi:type I restriction enzyme M protein
MLGNELDIKTLETWLWEAACKIRGEIDAPKYKDYILPLIFLKRLSDVFEDEIMKLSADYGGRDVVEELLKGDHSLVRFYVPEDARWGSIAMQTTGIGEYLTDTENSYRRSGQIPAWFEGC